MGRRRARHGQPGFSLAEVVIALLILSVMSVVLVGVIPSTMYAMKTAENRLKGACLARQALENIAAGGFDAAVSKDLDPTRSNGTEFRIKVAVTPVQGASGGTLDFHQIKNVQVTVSWMERNLILDYTASVIIFRR